MKSSNQQRITGKLYEVLSKASSIAMKGNTHGKGKKRSLESKEKQRKSMIKKYQTQSYIHTGKTYEEIYGIEEAIKRKEKLKGKRGPRKNPPGPQKLLTCVHCNKTGGVSNMKRYHFDNCLFQ